MGKNTLKPSTIEENVIPEIEEEVVIQEKRPKRTKKKVKKNTENKRPAGSIIKGILDGSILTRRFVIRSIPMILLLVFLGILFIANRYWIENTSLKIKELNNELEQLRIKHIETKQEYMRASTLTEIAKALDSTGIEQSTERPQKINIKNE